GEIPRRLLRFSLARSETFPGPVLRSASYEKSARCLSLSCEEVNKMFNYKGGNRTKGGFYLKKGEWEIVTLEGKNGMLPGGNECEYLRVPGILFVPLAVTLGGAFVIFLPFIGFAMLFAMIATKVAQGVNALAEAFAQKLAEWQPLRMPVAALATVSLVVTTGLRALTRALPGKFTALKPRTGG